MTQLIKGLPLPVEQEPPPEPLVTLRVTFRNGRQDAFVLPASAAHALALWPADDWASARIVYPAGVLDLFGQSA